MRKSTHAVLSVSSAVALALFLARAAAAEEAAGANVPDSARVDGRGVALEEIVVTGSRIRRDASDTTTNEPLNIVTAQTLADRGYTQAGEALNAITAITPSNPLTPHDGTSSGNGQQFPDLFNLGPGRTLTLVNGRRFVNSVVAHNDASGFSVDPAVDTNMIPTGLLERVDVVEAGGSVVYGSDAIAGVVNYVLKDHFTGAEFDAQAGRSSRNDYPQYSARGTFGTDFAGGRGNVAVDLEWAKTQPLAQTARPDAAISYTAADSNPLYAGPGGGIPSVAALNDSRFWEFNNNGVLFVRPPGTGAGAYQAAFGAGFFVTRDGRSFANGGTPTQFNAAGTGLIPFNPGTFPAGTLVPSASNNVPGPASAGYVSPVFASGGDGYAYSSLTSLFSGVERRAANVIGHWDVTDQIKLSMELTYGHTRGYDPTATYADNTVLNDTPSGRGAVVINANNPYLPASARATIYNYLKNSFGPGLAGLWMAQGAPGVPPLSAAVPGFAVELSKIWSGLLPSTAGITETDTLRALFALDGHFSLADRDFDWQVAASRGHSHGEFRRQGVLVNRLNNALDAVDIGTAGSPNIVCRVNAASVTDPACQPISPFGSGPYSAAQQAYVSGTFGEDQSTTHDDYLATIAGPLVSLPAGQAKLSATYEHRRESQNFDPTQDALLGLGAGGSPTVATSGAYHTNELSTELLIPLLGKSVSLPGIHSLELEGAYRYVNNSLAGTANLWQTGIRWTITPGVTLRASRSVNFRAPNLNEAFAPTQTALGAVLADPCDSREINAGINPAARRANCEAEFAAHPTYNNGTGSLANYQDPAQNFNTALVTSTGNRNLQNEVSRTWTYGFVLQPGFAPGLTVVADRIEIKLVNALSQFLPENFLQSCYDTTGPQRAATCGTFTRNANGDIVTATSTFINAGFQVYRGETYNVNYQLNPLTLNLELTHNDVNDISVTGTDLTRLAGEAQSPLTGFGMSPRWVGRFDAAYNWKNLRLTYELFYLPRTRLTTTATADSSATPWIATNIRHSISAAYPVTDAFTVRAGVINLTDKMPSYPTLGYGDILGRRYFLGVNLHL